MVKASFGIPDYSSAYWPKLLGRTRTVMDKIAPTKVSDELSRGGLDSPTNMQWQAIQAAKTKDKTA